MRTTLNIDDEALRDYGRRRALRGLRKLAGKVGWSGDLDALRKRKLRPS